MSSHQIQLEPSVIVGVNDCAIDEPWVELSQELSDYEFEDSKSRSFFDYLLVMHSCGQVSGREFEICSCEGMISLITIEMVCSFLSVPRVEMQGVYRRGVKDVRGACDG